MEKERLLVLGARGFLGQHLMQHLHESATDISLIRTLDLNQEFQQTLEYRPRLPVETEWGTWDEWMSGQLLPKSLAHSDVVINAIDYQDLRILADKEKLKQLNESLVEELARAAESAGVKRLIHVSSLLVTASFMAPSVFKTEISATPPSPAFSIFPDYVRAKQNAEKALDNLSAQVFILRIPFLYGEGDRSSFILDVLRYAEAHEGICPLLNRPHGKTQYAYAGNIGAGIVAALHRMRKEAPGRKELVHLLDNTPVSHTWDFLAPFAKVRGFSAPPKDVPFYLAYVPWRLAELGCKAAQSLRLRVPDRLAAFPSAGLLYAHFFYWYFWSGVKARLFLDFLPPDDYEAALDKSLPYYANLDLSTINVPEYA